MPFKDESVKPKPSPVIHVPHNHPQLMNLFSFQSACLVPVVRPEIAHVSIQIAERVPFPNPQEIVVVQYQVKILVYKADGLQHFFSPETAWLTDKVGIFHNIRVRHLVAGNTIKNLSVLVHVGNVAIEKKTSGILLEVLRNCAEDILFVAVVGVKPGDYFSRCHTESLVYRVALTAVLF